MSHGGMFGFNDPSFCMNNFNNYSVFKIQNEKGCDKYWGTSKYKHFLHHFYVDVYATKA